jgi:hypothetical protein
MVNIRKYGISVNVKAFEGYTEETFIKEMEHSGSLGIYEIEERKKMFKEIWKDISKLSEPPKKEVKDKPTEKGAS